MAEQERIERLAIWFGHSANAFPDITWYEFAAATGSTLAIFSLVSQVFSPGFMQGDATAIRNAHFPWIQGLHMLIDYFIDRDKDRLGGDFHFCSCYADEERKADRFVHILADGAPCCQGRPQKSFPPHGLSRPSRHVPADRILDTHKSMRPAARRILRAGGWPPFLFFGIIGLYRRLIDRVPH